MPYRARAPFRGRLAAAPLKAEPPRQPDAGAAPFRGRLAAAPLKAYPDADRGGQHYFPRPFGRGPIEGHF